MPTPLDTGPQLLSTTGLVLEALLEEPGATIRELARRCQKTERAVWQQLRRLEALGLLRAHRLGRRNHYVIDIPALRSRLRHEAPLLVAASSAVPLREREARPPLEVVAAAR